MSGLYDNGPFCKVYRVEGYTRGNYQERVVRHFAKSSDAHSFLVKYLGGESGPNNVSRVDVTMSKQTITDALNDVIYLFSDTGHIGNE